MSTPNSRCFVCQEGFYVTIVASNDPDPFRHDRELSRLGFETGKLGSTQLEVRQCSSCSNLQLFHASVPPA